MTADATGRQGDRMWTRAGLVFATGLVLAGCGGGAAEPREPAQPAPGSASPSPRELSLEDELQAELDIADQPDWLTTGFGSVWVMRDEAAAVDRIDPETNEVVATVEVGEHPCNGIVAAYDGIWVPSCEEQAVYRIDPETDEVAAVIDVPVFLSTTGALGHELAAGAGSIWMVTEGKAGKFDALARIDPRANEVAATIPLGHPGAGVAASDEAVWVTSPDDGAVVRLDPTSGEIVTEIDGLEAPNFVSVADDGVWVLSGLTSARSGGDGSVTVIDAATDTVASKVVIDERPGQASDIAAADGFVWVRTQYTLLAKIDAISESVVERYTDQKGIGGVAVGFGSVWLSDIAFNNVWRVPA